MSRNPAVLQRSQPEIAFRLEFVGQSWEIPIMKAVKVDSTKRIRLPSLVPGDLYEPQIGADVITLRRIPPPRRKWTRSEVLRAINKSRLKFSRSWEEIRAETREL